MSTAEADSGGEATLPRELSGPSDTLDAGLSEIRSALRGLRFGQVTVIVQDGVVIQIDRTDKRRLRRPARVAPVEDRGQR